MTALRTITGDRAAIEAVAEVAADTTVDEGTMMVSRLMAQSHPMQNRPTCSAAPRIKTRPTYLRSWASTAQTNECLTATKTNTVKSLV